MRRLQWSNTVLPSRPHPPLPPPYFLPIRPAPLRVRSRPLRSAREPCGFGRGFAAPSPCGFGRGFAASSPLGSSAPSPEDPAPAIRVPSERSDPFWSSRVQLESPRSSRVQFESPRSSQVQSESPRSSQVQAESPRSSRVQLESPRPLQTIKKIRRLSIAPILADQAERGQLEYSQAERGQAERSQAEPKAPRHAPSLPSLPNLPLSRSRTATSAHQPGLESVSQRPLERPRPPPAGRPDTANRGRRGAARGRPESCSRASRPGPRAPPGAMPGLGGELPGEDGRGGEGDEGLLEELLEGLLEGLLESEPTRTASPARGDAGTGRRATRGGREGPRSCSRASRPGPRAPPGAMPGLGGEPPGEDGRGRGAARGRPESRSRASRPGPRAPPGAMPGLGGEPPGEDRKATHTIGPVGHDCIHLVCCAEVGSEGAVTGWRTIRQWSASGPPNGG